MAPTRFELAKHNRWYSFLIYLQTTLYNIRDGLHWTLWLCFGWCISACFFYFKTAENQTEIDLDILVKIIGKMFPCLWAEEVRKFALKFHTLTIRTKNEDLEIIHQWLLANKLTLNKEKTEYMVIRSRKRRSKILIAPEIHVGETTLKQV
jgi:hypothetical protein